MTPHPPIPVALLDTTLRDGASTPGVTFSLEDKLTVAGALADAGVDVIEVAFPRTAVGELEVVRALCARIRNASLCCLTRDDPGEIDAAGEALRGAALPRLHVFAPARGRAARTPERVAAAVRRARRHVAAVELSPLDAMRADLGVVATLARAAVEAGATTVNVSDTAGTAEPADVERVFRSLRDLVPELAGVVLSFHGHDDRARATANALAAVAAGARQLEVALNGLGPRGGNTSLQSVVEALRQVPPGAGAATLVDTTRLDHAARLVAARTHP